MHGRESFIRTENSHVLEKCFPRNEGVNKNIVYKWNEEMIKTSIRLRLWYTHTHTSVQFSSVQSVSHVRLFTTPWIAAHTHTHTHTHIYIDIYIYIHTHPHTYIWTSLMALLVKNLPAMQETRVWFPSQKIPWRRKWQPTPVLLPREFHGQWSRAGYSPWDCKESDMTVRLTFTSIYKLIYIYIHTHTWVCV